MLRNVTPFNGLDIDAARALKQQQIMAAFAAKVSAITAGYPQDEQMTWPIQRSEALAWQADSGAPTPFCDGIAAARGMERLAFMPLVVAQAQAFQSTVCVLLGVRQSLRDAIDAASTVSAVAAIEWPD